MNIILARVLNDHLQFMTRSWFIAFNGFMPHLWSIEGTTNGQAIAAVLVCRSWLMALSTRDRVSARRSKA